MKELISSTVAPAAKVKKVVEKHAEMAEKELKEKKPKKEKAPPVKKSKKAEIKEAVIEACKEAQKVYDTYKDKRNYYTGQIGDEGKRAIGKAEEAIRNASSSKGGGTFVMLTEKELDTLVKKYYPKEGK